MLFETLFASLSVPGLRRDLLHFVLFALSIVMRLLLALCGFLMRFFLFWLLRVMVIGLHYPSALLLHGSHVLAAFFTATVTTSSVTVIAVVPASATEAPLSFRQLSLSLLDLRILQAKMSHG